MREADPAHLAEIAGQSEVAHQAPKLRERLLEFLVYVTVDQALVEPVICSQNRRASDAWRANSNRSPASPIDVRSTASICRRASRYAVIATSSSGNGAAWGSFSPVLPKVRLGRVAGVGLVMNAKATPFRRRQA